MSLCGASSPAPIGPERTGAADVPVSVVLAGPVHALAHRAARFEAAGVAGLWTGDYFQSAPVRAAIIGAATARVAVGTHVLQAFARSPLATALAAQELQDLTAGRFVLGLGSQLPAANRRWHGVDLPRPLAALEEYVRALRALLETPAGARSTFHGDLFAHDVPPFRAAASQPPPPIWIGGAGPAAADLAGRLADGLAGHLLWTWAHVRDRVLRHIEPLPVTVPRLVAPDGVPGWRRDLIRRLAHYLVTPAYQELLVRQGVAIDREVVLVAVKEGDDAAMQRAVEPYLEEWSAHDASSLRRQRVAAAEHGVSGLVLLAPVNANNPERTGDYEDALAELLAHDAAPRPDPGGLTGVRRPSSGCSQPGGRRP